LKWGLLFDERRGLTATGHLLYWGWLDCTHTHTHTTHSTR
jgi:hypothetical protein